MEAKNQGTLPHEKQQELDELLHEYKRIVMIRAQAAVLLQQRGYDVSDPATLNESPVA